MVLTPSPARLAWEDAFEVAAILADHHGITNLYSDRNEAFVEGVKDRFLGTGEILPDEYENNFLVALQVALKVLDGGVDEVRGVCDQFREDRLDIEAINKRYADRHEDAP